MKMSDYFPALYEYHFVLHTHSVCSTLKVTGSPEKGEDPKLHMPHKRKTII